MTLKKFRVQLIRMLVLGVCVLVASKSANVLTSRFHGTAPPPIDIASVYISARSAAKHHDPYDPATALHEYEAGGGTFSTLSGENKEFIEKILTVANYPPTTLLAVAPLALLPLKVAVAVWLGLMYVLLVLAALLTWDLAEAMPLVAGCMASFMLANCVFLIATGNPAGVAVSLCVIATWCFLKERFAACGVAMLVLSLALKPQIAGFVWLYFFLAGGKGRKWAIQTLAVVGAFSICAVVWVASSSPHWVQEFQRNFGSYVVRGGVADPGPEGSSFKGVDVIINLQTAASVFRDDPRFYNPVAWLIGGGLILAWSVIVLRKRSVREGALLALAAISILTLLPIYHRSHDAKLLLLSFPACSMLWAAGGARRWVAVAITAAAILVTTDVAMLIWVALLGASAVPSNTFGGKLALLAVHPEPLVLLAAGCFYLWAYIRFEAPGPGTAERDDVAERQAEPAAS